MSRVALLVLALLASSCDGTGGLLRVEHKDAGTCSAGEGGGGAEDAAAGTGGACGGNTGD